MSDTRAGQPSERTPDFIPGWFEARPGNPDPASREAVRFIDTLSFPINFLRPTEMVSPAPIPQLGVYVGERDSAIGMCLAVPPGYWMVRGADGRPQLYSDEDFKAAYIRNEGQSWQPTRRWVAADENPTEFRSEITSLPPEAWKGTPPAEGTRRKLILDTLEGFSLRLISGDEPAPASCLGAADAVEAALLGTVEQAVLGSGDDELLFDAAEAINAVGDALDRIDAPQGATYAERIDRLDRDFALRCDSLLTQRKRARAGEDAFKAQRDAALHLLRWLIGDLIPANLIRFQAEEKTDA